MSALVIDASATLSWLLEDESTMAALAVRHRVVVGGAVVPVIWRTEVANALLAASRRGRLSREDGVEALEDLAQLRIEADPDGWDRTWNDTFALAVEHRLTVYDAAYLELVLRRTLPLATLDVELRDAAAQRGIEIL